MRRKLSLAFTLLLSAAVTFSSLACAGEVPQTEQFSTEVSASDLETDMITQTAASDEATGSDHETADIFATAMENNYKVGSQVIAAILDGTIS